MTPKNVTFFRSKLLLDSFVSCTASSMKDLCQKMDGKTIFFQGACRLPETKIVECLQIIDVEGNLKQFDDLA